jgi:ribosomal protein L11 methyltransferase
MMSVKYQSLPEETVEDKDWVEVFKQHFVPFEMNEKFFVVPDWEKDNYQQYHNNKQVIVIEPGQAFGTGLHPTTSLASLLIAKYSENNKDYSLLDAGTGSGILSVVAKKTGAKKITAYDIDPVCEESFKKHFKLNGLTMDNITFFTGTEKKLKGEKFDVVVINIIEKIIRNILPDLKTKVKDKLILSGLLAEHYPEFKKFLTEHNIEIIEKKEKENWVALLCNVN